MKKNIVKLEVEDYMLSGANRARSTEHHITFFNSLQLKSFSDQMVSHAKICSLNFFVTSKASQSG